MENKIKCSNCSSENIQFGTSTSGGGFSFSNSCCGYLALGPLGLLCGACGSGTKTEEFWVCQSCGHKFSNYDAQKAREREIADKEKAFNNYLENKKVRDEMIKKYGNSTTINRQLSALLKDKDEASERYNEALDAFIEQSTDAKIKKLDKKRKKTLELHIELLLIAIVLAIITLIFGLLPITIPIAIFGVILFIYAIYRIINPIQSILDNIFTENSPEGKRLYDEMNNAKKEYEQFEEKARKTEDCYQYEKYVKNEE